MISNKIPGYRLKAKNSDFVVNEISFIPENLSPEKSTFTYVLMEKENATTFDALMYIAKSLKLSLESVSASGLKDELAVTNQAISVKKIIENTDLPKINKMLKNKGKIRFVSIMGYGKVPLSPKILHGNTFTIKIRNLSSKIAKNLQKILKTSQYQEFINYYDEQRFGTPKSTHNSHLIGEAILENDWPKAMKEYLISGNNGEERKNMLQIYKETKSEEKAILQMGSRKIDFFVSSYNSFLWNRELDNLVKRGEKSVSVVFPDLGKLSLPKNSSTGIPLMLTTTSYEYDHATKRKNKTQKTRPAQVVTCVHLVNEEPDSLFKGKRAVTISFVLPTGSYATMFIKQLLIKSKN